MTHEQATEALSGAMEQDAKSESENSIFKQEAPTEGQPAVDASSTPQGSEPGATRPRDDFGRFAAVAPQPTESGAPAADTSQDGFAQSFDPNALAPELQTAYKQMQADYTRKTQEISEQRRQFEQLGDVDQLRQAAELYQTLQDPAAWPAVAAELSAMSEQYGGQQAPQQPTPDLGALADDPELAPIAGTVQGLSQQVQSLQSELQSMQFSQQQEAMEMQLIGDIQQKEAIVRQQNPHYGEADVDAIYKIAVSHDGDLLAAQRDYEGIKQAVLGGYLQSKQGATQAAGPIAPVAGGGTVSEEQAPLPESLDDVTDAAIARLRAAGLDTFE